MRKADTLFARLFGLFLAAIVLAHLLAFLWFSQYGKPPAVTARLLRRHPAPLTPRARRHAHRCSAAPGCR